MCDDPVPSVTLPLYVLLLIDTLESSTHAHNWCSNIRSMSSCAASWFISVSGHIKIYESIDSTSDSYNVQDIVLSHSPVQLPCVPVSQQQRRSFRTLTWLPSVLTTSHECQPSLSTVSMRLRGGDSTVSDCTGYLGKLYSIALSPGNSQLFQRCKRKVGRPRVCYIVNRSVWNSSCFRLPIHLSYGWRSLVPTSFSMLHEKNKGAR